MDQFSTVGVDQFCTVGNSKKRFRGYDFLSGMGMVLASPTALLWFAAIGGSIIAQSRDGSTLMVSVFLSGFFHRCITVDAVPGRYD